MHRLQAHPMPSVVCCTSFSRSASAIWSIFLSRFLTVRRLLQASADAAATDTAPSVSNRFEASFAVPALAQSATLGVPAASDALQESVLKTDSTPTSAPAEVVRNADVYPS